MEFAHQNFTGKVVAPMRNNSKTSVIDCGGYKTTSDMILSFMVRSLASHNWHGVEFEGRALE
jgi:hypothetical protein